VTAPRCIATDPAWASAARAPFAGLEPTTSPRRCERASCGSATRSRRTLRRARRRLVQNARPPPRLAITPLACSPFSTASPLCSSGVSKMQMRSSGETNHTRPSCFCAPALGHEADPTTRGRSLASRPPPIVSPTRTRRATELALKASFPLLCQHVGQAWTWSRTAARAPPRLCSLGSMIRSVG